LQINGNKKNKPAAPPIIAPYSSLLQSDFKKIQNPIKKPAVTQEANI